MAAQIESRLRTGEALDDSTLGAERGNGAPEGAVGFAPTDEDEAQEKRVPPIVEVACRFAAARKRPAAVYLLGEGNPIDGTPDTPITKRSVSRLAAALKDSGDFEQLDLVVHSSGGDIHAAYQMMTLLRGRMAENGELVTCVPRRAQSSATLLCLGGDRIVLDELGALGPLDAQIRVGVTDAGTADYSSALHLLNGLNRLQDFSLDALQKTAARLYDRRVRRTEDVLRFSIDFSRGITAPLFERIESHKIGYWDQMLRTGEWYGRRLMRRGKLIREVPDFDRDAHVERVVRQLVNDYPSHEYVIDVEELTSKLDLNAELMTDDERAVAREFEGCASDTLIMMVYPPGTPAGPEMDQPSETTLRDWNSFSYDGPARYVSWRSGKGEFLMRVGLYRRPIKSSRNPWRGAQVDEEAPSTQHSTAGDDPGWSGEEQGWSIDQPG